MNYHKYIKLALLAMTFACAGTTFTSCEDDIMVGTGDSGRYDNIEGTYGYVKNMGGARDLSTIEIFGNGTGKAQLYFELTTKATQKVDVKLKVDKAALDAYNTANGTSYEMYPETMVSLANGGVISIAAEGSKSEAVDVTVQNGGTIGQVYALPISAEVTAGGVALAKNNQSYIFLVKPMGAIPSSDKGTGMKAICYIEVNDENILNAGEFTMKSSGKPFFDVVNIFAANINFNKETGRVYVNCNDNVSYILKNADKFIKPLQAKGIKVCLTILGNHDEAGVANLTKETAAELAKELRFYVDTYGLDGIDFDDEYSKYQENPSPGFEKPSKEASARLMYECRKVMPDKILSFYDWNSYAPTGNVENGQAVGEILDYAYYGYYGTWNESRLANITGLEKTKYCPYAVNLKYDESNGGYDLANIKKVRTSGYGIQMFYNLKARDYDYSKAFSQFGNILFDDDVEWTGRIFEKTAAQGEIYIPSYQSYIGTWTLTSNQALYWHTEGGTYWQWKDPITYTLRIEENVANESYRVYGWGVDGDKLPFIMNYTKFGRVEINLPQTLTENTLEGNKDWTLVSRYSYSFTSTNFTTNDVLPAFSGWIKSNGAFTIKGLTVGIKSIKTMAPAVITNNKITDIHGGLYQDVAYEPFGLTKQ